MVPAVFRRSSPGLAEQPLKWKVKTIHCSFTGDRLPGLTYHPGAPPLGHRDPWLQLSPLVEDRASYEKQAWRSELCALGPGVGGGVRGGWDGGGEQDRTKAGLPELQGLACPAACLFVVFRVCLGGRPSPTHLLPNSYFNQGSLTLIRLGIDLLPSVLSR